MKFLFWSAIVCSLLGFLLNTASLILRQAFDMASVITTVTSTAQMVGNVALFTFTLMVRRIDNEL